MIGGFLGGARKIGALLLGKFEDGALRYVGMIHGDWDFRTYGITGAAERTLSARAGAVIEESTVDLGWLIAGRTAPQPWMSGS